MNVDVAAGKRGWWQAIEVSFRRFDLARIGQRRWWIIFLLAIAALVLLNFVRNWATCQFLYQVELEAYMAAPGASGRPPQPPSTPLITVLSRIGGQAINTALRWAGWAAGLYLGGLLLGQVGLRLDTVLGVVAWSWLPFVLRALAQCLYMALARDPIWNAGLSGLALDSTPPPPGGGTLYVMPTRGQLIGAALLAHVDLYLFWHLALIVAGLRQRLGFAPRKALTVTLSVTIVLALVGLAPTFFGGALQRFRLF